MKLPELLAPAGSREAFRGALSAGADAVYLGGMKFGARAYAANFSDEEIITSLREAHILGKKVYLTLNILTKESEMEETIAFAQRMHRAGLDGVIVQDIGVAAALHSRCPSLPVHASTQMSVTTSDAVRLLKKIGVVRVVPARELSLEEIKAMKREEPIEIETFIHGAMCYGYSGRCLFSSFLGGRSGNRGRCAGTCRLPYGICDEEGKDLAAKTFGRSGKKEMYPLSMRDLNVLSVLPDLIDAGIDSFKIEGRMKSPHYAAGVTALYRKYMDLFVKWDAQGRKKPWKVDPRDEQSLRSLYLRTSLSTGYYYRRNGRELLTMDKPGYAGTDAELLDQIEAKYLRSLSQREVSAEAVLCAGAPASLTLRAGKGPVTVTVYGDAVQTADKRPLSTEEISRRLKKTGDSMIRITDLTVLTSGSVFLPVSALNALRRSAVEEMENKLAGMHAHAAGDDIPCAEAEKDQQVRPAASAAVRGAGRGAQKSAADTGPEVWAQVTSEEQLRAAIESGVTHVIAECSSDIMSRSGEITAQARAASVSICIALPHILRMADREKVRRLIRLNKGTAAGFLARTPEELQLLADEDYRGQIIADGFLYQWNLTARDLISQYADRMVLPLELSAADMDVLVRGDAKNPRGSRTGSRSLLTVYGRIPMMLSAECVRKTMGTCTHREGGFMQLVDRKGARFPVRCACSYCYNVIYNSLPLSLHKFADRQDPLMFAAGGWICAFTTESESETRRILSGFVRAARREQSALFASETGTYTTGHYRKSAL